jgi:hypothetical protein
MWPRMTAALVAGVLGSTVLTASTTAEAAERSGPGVVDRAGTALERATADRVRPHRPAGGTGPMVTVPGSFTGFGFDACTAPSQKVMDTWRTTSPHLAVGVYIGGEQRRCEQPELDAGWVRRQVRSGWHVLPLYVGPQASCSGYEHRMSEDRATALVEGRRAASLAVVDARALAIGRGSTLYYDLEDYDLSGDACRQAALSFLSGWTERLHALGYDSGVYSNVAAAITSLDYADRVSPGSYEMPDDLWFAWANGKADTDAGAWVSGDRWDEHARIHQYVVDEHRTHGGQRLTVDLNFVDVGRGSVAPRARRTCGVDLDLAAYPVRGRGARGAAVSAAQCLLKQAGHGRVRVTGRFDRATVRATRAAQRAHELRVTGRVTRRTWTALLAAGARQVVKVGSTGEPVRHLQRALVATLGRPLPVTGTADARTTARLRTFQRRAGLPPHGVADVSTWKRLQAGG